MRAACVPSTLLGVRWGVRYEIALVRRLNAACFDPKPSVDAGLLRIVRRAEPLVAAAQLGRFDQLAATAFAAGGRPLRRSLEPAVAPALVKRGLRGLGFDSSASAADLDVEAWASLYERIAGVSRVGTRSGSSRPAPG